MIASHFLLTLLPLVSGPGEVHVQGPLPVEVRWATRLGQGETASFLPEPWITLEGTLPQAGRDGRSWTAGSFRVECGMGPYRPPGVRPVYETWKAAAASGRKNVHLYTYAATIEGEPVFFRDSGKQARTARDWLLAQGKPNPAGLHFFDTLDGEPPTTSNLTPTIRLDGTESWPLRGFLYFNAEKVVLEAAAGAAGPVRVHLPGEPFLDQGLDLDGDGSVCSERGPGACCPTEAGSPAEQTRCNEFETVGNGVWDVELDPDCSPDLGACDSDAPGSRGHPQAGRFAEIHAPSPGGLPHAGADPRLLALFPHEAFLNLSYPARWGEPARLDWNAADGSGRNTTTTGRDPLGPEVLIPLHLHGLLFTEGRLVLGDGFLACGALYAGHGIKARGRAAVIPDPSLALDRWPPTGIDVTGRGSPRWFD